MKIGDYVNVALANGKNGESRQGVYVRNNSDGTIPIRGEGDTYRCQKDGVVVDDKDIFDYNTLEFVKQVRRQLGL